MKYKNYVLHLAENIHSFTILQLVIQLITNARLAIQLGFQLIFSRVLN